MAAPTRNLTGPVTTTMANAVPVVGCKPVPGIYALKVSIRRIASPFFPISRVDIAPVVTVMGLPPTVGFDGVISSMLWRYPKEVALGWQTFPRGNR